MLLKLPTPILLALIFVMAFPACKKKDATKPRGTSYTSGMGGRRNWHGSYRLDKVSIHDPTPVHIFYNYRDTSLTVTVVDDTTIKMMDNVYLYVIADTQKQIYFFGDFLGGLYGYGSGTCIAYYYSKDSIAYWNTFIDNHFGQWTSVDLRYTF